AVRIPYRDEAGAERAVRFRLALEGERFRWRTGSKPCLYGLDHLPAARAAGYVTLVEGESDVQTLLSYREPALGLPGADGWREDWSRYLEGIPLVYVVIEPDTGAEAIRKWLAGSEIRERVRLVSLDGAKDASALYLARGDGFPHAWKAALTDAVAWTT